MRRGPEATHHESRCLAAPTDKRTSKFEQLNTFAVGVAVSRHGFGLRFHLGYIAIASVAPITAIAPNHATPGLSQPLTDPGAAARIDSRRIASRCNRVVIVHRHRMYVLRMTTLHRSTPAS